MKQGDWAFVNIGLTCLSDLNSNVCSRVCHENTSELSGIRKCQCKRLAKVTSPTQQSPGKV